MNLPWELLYGVAGVIVVDLVLAGDNALLIGLAVQKLRRDVRRKAIFWGSIGAILFRIILVLFTFQLLSYPVLRAIGGTIIILIAMKLALAHNEERQVRETNRFWEALWLIISADAIMSLDNVLAVAAVARNNFLVFLFGIGVSLPFIFWGSQTLARLMDKYPILILIGGLFLGWVGGLMITEDVVLHHYFLSLSLKYGFAAACTALIFTWWLLKRQTQKQP